MLAHARLDRAGQLARHLAAGGMPGVVHLDRRVPASAREAFAGEVARGTQGVQDVTVISEHAGKWGQFGLVAATLAGVERLLADHPGLGHVCLVSGSCLPLRPVADLLAFLAAAGQRDFIESVPVSQDHWVESGLSLERFTLYHPLSHRTRPSWFSRLVELQRALKVRRRLPPGLEPHLGAQWWCLSTRTLRAILDHPDRPGWERFFRLGWIPDESFFQTIVRAVRLGDDPGDEPGPKLHFGRFNRLGRPIVFHDDHADYLSGIDHFFARKTDPDADGLYARFLAPDLPSRGAGFTGAVDEAPVRAARERHVHEARGVLGPGRFPKGSRLNRCDTVRPFLVIAWDEEDLLEALWPRLQALAPEHVVHGRLFREYAPSAFVTGAMTYAGNLPGQPILREYRAPQFLARLIWADRDRPVVFLLGAGDSDKIRAQLVTDPNTRLLLLHHGSPEDATAAAGAMLADLVKPLGWRSARARVPLTQRAWYRGLDADALRADLADTATDTGDGGALHELADIVRGDWSNPEGWSIP